MPQMRLDHLHLALQRKQRMRAERLALSLLHMRQHKPHKVGLCWRSLWRVLPRSWAARKNLHMERLMTVKPGALLWRRSACVLMRQSQAI